METAAAALLPHLPYLRRYARALTGSVEAGDDLVAGAVESALREASPAALGPGPEGRIGLYALLNRLSTASAPAPDPSTPVHPIERALSGLPEADRRTFLLVSLEELALEQAAAILGLDPDQARTNLSRARTALREQLVATILIVEDDAIIAYDLAETVRLMGHRVCGTAATMDEALATAETGHPTLALMDIRLAQGNSGIATAQALRRRFGLPVIFVTAFADELAQRGLAHLGPVIRKPFERTQIERAITQAVFTPTPARPVACV